MARPRCSCPAPSSSSRRRWKGSEPVTDDSQAQLEALLSDALRPIEPPEDLASRVETTLTSITEQAAAELSSWAEELSESELESLRDPRNWVRPVAAGAPGPPAGGAPGALGGG